MSSNSLNQLYAQLPFSFDPEKLLKDLQQVHKSEWVNHPNKNAYEGVWMATSLMSTSGEATEIMALENQAYKATGLLAKAPYIQQVIDTFQTKVEAVRFMKLGGYSLIKTHRDRGTHFDEDLARLHIPVMTHENVDFILDGKKVPMDIGNCYYIDADVPHSVVNNSDQDRVHLLIDCQINGWLKVIFTELGFKDRDYQYGNKGIDDQNVDQIIEALRTQNTEGSLKLAEELLTKKKQNKETNN